MLHAKDGVRSGAEYVVRLLRWLVFSVVIGGIVGLIGTAFGYAMQYATGFRAEHNWIIYCLPLLGLVIAAIYQKGGLRKNKGTNLVLEAVSSDETIPARVAPAIFISTVLTHLGGGSAGREGAALQLGGSLGTFLGKFFKLDDNDRKISVMCGMSAAFAALFGTPVTAAIFPMEVVSVGIMHYAALVPCAISSVVAAGIAKAFGLHAESFPVETVPVMGIGTVGKLILLAILCGGVSVIFCSVLHTVEKLFKTKIPNVYLRVAVGGAMIIIMTLLVGSQEYNGAGMNVIERCVMEGEVFWAAWVLKLLFTAVTLGSGFRGGEIVPAFFVGATFGCLVGQLIGLSPMLAAACGMVGVFCGVTNCPIASLFMAMELFGTAGIQYYLLMIAVSYCMSGYTGLYGSQKIMYSKFRTEFINRKTGH